MKILKHLSDIFKKPGKPGILEESRKTGFISKYHAFEELLSQNNTVLELMADVEYRLSGDSIPDRLSIQGVVSQIMEGVHTIIDKLNVISRNKYPVLYDRYKGISGEIEKILHAKMEIPLCRYAVPFSEITKKDIYEFGNKNANLGEVKNNLKIPVPEGFAVSTFAFKKFLEYNKLFTEVHNLVSAQSIDDIDSLNHMSEELRRRILQADMPSDLETEIYDAYLQLCEKCGHVMRVAIRSSAVHEDSELSFAGQYATFLNVPSHQIVQKYKEVVASLFSPGALYYFKTKGFQEYEMAMSVGILEMIDAESAGVLYTKDPNNPEDNSIVISSVFGMGKPVVEGIAIPATYRVKRYPFFTIIKEDKQVQTDMLICRDNGDIERVPLPEDIKTRPCLSEQQIRTLSEYAIAIEDHYQCPQDIEWAVDKAGRIYVLQTRPLMMAPAQAAKQLSILIKGYRVLLDNGITASKGTGYGKACIMDVADDLKNFPDNSVLVTKYASTRFVPVLEKARAIITDIGCATMHMATIAREFGVPAIVGTGTATQVIKSGQDLTVDATNCIVYEGLVQELIGLEEKKKAPLPQTHFLTSLMRMKTLIIPLTLINLDEVTFTSESCRTLHDITRFAHQKAMYEMFKMTKEFPEDIETCRLRAGIPLCIDIIDLEESIEGEYKKLGPGDIHSFPFNAFLRGLSALPWPEPRHVDVKGFFGMVAHTAAIPEEELEQMGERSFAFISKEYMNFSIRLGYHLSVIDAYTGENINDNYIRFFFKGGGADIQRRLRRVRLITEVLKKLGFYIKSREDVIDALITKDTKQNLEEKLYILGKITVYTKQMDAIMYDEEVADKYLKEFLRESFPLFHG